MNMIAKVAEWDKWGEWDNQSRPLRVRFPKKQTTLLKPSTKQSTVSLFYSVAAFSGNSVLLKPSLKIPLCLNIKQNGYTDRVSMNRFSPTERSVGMFERNHTWLHHTWGFGIWGFWLLPAHWILWLYHNTNTIPILTAARDIPSKVTGSNAVPITN